MKLTIHPLTPAQARRTRLQALTDKAQGVPPRLVAYRGQRPVGWVARGPREDSAKLKRSPAMKRLDGMPVWPVVRLHAPQPGQSQPA